MTSRCLFFAVMAFLLPSAASVTRTMSVSIPDLKVARSTGVFGKFGFPVRPFSTVVSCWIRSVSDIPLKPSNALSFFTFVVIRFFLCLNFQPLKSQHRKKAGWPNFLPIFWSFRPGRDRASRFYSHTYLIVSRGLEDKNNLSNSPKRRRFYNCRRAGHPQRI